MYRRNAYCEEITINSTFPTLNNLFKMIYLRLELIFEFNEEKFVDLNTNSTWNINGSSNIGTLEPIYYFDVMWFAWNAFHPDTTLIYQTPL